MDLKLRLLEKKEKYMILRIDHVSLAVNDFEKAKGFFSEIFGAVPGSNGSDDDKKFFWEIFSVGDLSRLEIIAPTGKGSFIDKFLEGRNGGVHHITFQVDDIEKTRELLQTRNIPFFEGKDYGGVWKEIFVHPRDAFGVLIQFAEFNADDWLSKDVKFSGNRKFVVEKTADGCRIGFRHPGGGKVNLNLNSDEMEELVSSIRNIT